MNFTIRDDDVSKCMSCVHAFRAKTFKNPEMVTVCGMLKIPVGKIKECNHHMTLAQTGPPAHMLMDAWMIDIKKNRSGRVVGFSHQPPPTISELQEEAVKDTEK